MSTTAEKMRTELAALTETERAELAHFLIQSLDPGADEDAETEWDAELERRAEEIRNGHAAGEPADKGIPRASRQAFVKSVVVHHTARTELNEAMGFYESRTRGLGLDLCCPPPTNDGWNRVILTNAAHLL